jgi:hypothetical protein
MNCAQNTKVRGFAKEEKYCEGRAWNLGYAIVPARIMQKPYFCKNICGIVVTIVVL